MKRIGLIHEEESYVVRGLIYEIQKRLDVGWSESRQQDVENYEQIGSILTESDRVILKEIRQVVETTTELYGLGYPETLYRQVLAMFSVVRE